jgi:hypothetical protein
MKAFILVLALTSTLSAYAGQPANVDPLCDSGVFKQATSLLEENNGIYDSLWNQLSEGETVQDVMASATPEYCMAIGKKTLALWMFQKSLSDSDVKDRFSNALGSLHDIEVTLEDTCRSRQTQQFLGGTVYNHAKDATQIVQDINRAIGCYQ